MDEKQTKTQDNTLAIEIQNETPLETKDDIFDNKKEIENHKKSIDYIFVSHYMNDTHIYDTKYGPIHDDYVVTYSTEDKSFLGWLVNTEDNGPQQPDVTTYFPHDGEEDLSNVFSYVLLLIDLSGKQLLELKHPIYCDFNERFGEDEIGLLFNGDLIQASLNDRKIYKYLFKKKPENKAPWEYSQIYDIEIPENLNAQFTNLHCRVCQTKLFLIGRKKDSETLILQFDLLTMNLERHYNSLTSGSDCWKVMMNENQTLLAIKSNYDTCIFSMDNGMLILNREFPGGNGAVGFITSKNNSDRLIIQHHIGYRLIDPYQTYDQITISGDFNDKDKIITKLNRKIFIENNNICVKTNVLDENKLQQISNKTTNHNSIYTLSTFKFIQSMLNEINVEDITKFATNNVTVIKDEVITDEGPRQLVYYSGSNLLGLRKSGTSKYDTEFKISHMLSFKLLDNQNLAVISLKGIYIFTIRLTCRYFWYNDEWKDIYDENVYLIDYVNEHYMPLFKSILNNEFNDSKWSIPLPKLSIEAKSRLIEAEYGEDLIEDIANDRLASSLCGFKLLELLKIAIDKLDRKDKRDEDYKENYEVIEKLAIGIIKDATGFSKFGLEILRIAIDKKYDGIVRQIIDKIIKSIKNNSENCSYMILLPFISINLPKLCQNYYSDLLIKYISCTSIILSPYCNSIISSTNTSIDSYSNISINLNNNYLKSISSLYKKLIQYIQDLKEHLWIHEDIQTISFVVPFPQICVYQDNSKNNDRENHKTENNKHKSKIIIISRKLITLLKIIMMIPEKNEDQPNNIWNEFLNKPKSILFCNIDNNNFYNWWNFAAIVDFKWKTYGRIYYYSIWFFYTLFYICYALASTIEQNSLPDFYRKLLFIISIIFGSKFLIFDIRQCLWDYKYYFNDIWNLFDVGAYLLPIISSIFWLVNKNQPVWLMAISFILLSFKFLLFFRVFKSYGIYFAIIIGVAKTVFPFLVVLFFIVFGFSHAFFIILRSTSANDANDPINLVTKYEFINPDGTISNMIQDPDSNTNLFNWFPTSLLAVYKIITGDSGSLSPWTFRENPMMTVLLFIFTFFTVIYLMNLFIGLLNLAIGDYNKEEEFLLQKAQIIMEIELFYMLPPQKRNNKGWFPEWIYYDMPVTEVRKLINAIDNDKTVFNYNLPFISKKLKDLVAIKDEVREEMKNELKQQIDKVKQQMDEQNQQTRILLNAIIKSLNIDVNDEKENDKN